MVWCGVLRIESEKETRVSRVRQLYTDGGIPLFHEVGYFNVLEKAPKIEFIFKLIFGSKLQKYILFLKVDFMENRLYFSVFSGLSRRRPPVAGLGCFGVNFDPEHAGIWPNPIIVHCPVRRAGAARFTMAKRLLDWLYRLWNWFNLIDLCAGNKRSDHRGFGGCSDADFCRFY